MSLPILICDDSNFARRQIARALPADWDAEISFAGNGVEGVEALRAGKGDLLFLDLNMPEMDGYQVLETIRAEDLQTMVIVVSGDIQPQAQQRVRQLGALDFIRKPVNAKTLAESLDKYGIRAGKREPLADEPRLPPNPCATDSLDTCREVANVAMGRAADLLARLLDVFVLSPIPKVNRLEAGELRMALDQIAGKDTISAVCQGFTGAGIAGEALLMFHDASFDDIAALLHHQGEPGEPRQIEHLMDISNILIGAFLTAFAEQLDIGFSQCHPVVLGRHVKAADLIRRNASRWRRTLAVEIGYSIENRNINCDLLLLFTEDSIQPMQERIACTGD